MTRTRRIRGVGTDRLDGDARKYQEFCKLSIITFESVKSGENVERI